MNLSKGRTPRRLFENFVAHTASIFSLSSALLKSLTSIHTFITTIKISSQLTKVHHI